MTHLLQGHGLDTDLFIELKCMTWMQADIIMFASFFICVFIVSLASSSRSHFTFTDDREEKHRLAREII